MASFAQHSIVTARPGRHPELLAKFTEMLEFLRGNDECLVTIVSTTPELPDAVIITEVWTTEAAHEATVNTDRVQEWAATMPDLVAGAPQSTPLDVAGWLAQARPH